MSRHFTAPALVLVAALGNAGEDFSSPSQAQAPADPRILPSLQGSWTGGLEYRDYGSGDLVTIPAAMEAEMLPDQGLLLVRMAFQDPGRTVRELSLLGLDPESSQVRLYSFSGGRLEQSVLKVQSHRFDALDQWDLVADAKGTDNGRPAQLRTRMARVGERYIYLKEVRYQDQPAAEWFHRNTMTLRRVEPQPQQLVGTWQVDLRPTPDAEPSYQELVVEAVEDGTLRGRFYDTPIRDARLNTEWGTVSLAFTTEDGSGLYATSARLVDGRLEGVTHSLGRGFLSVWTATKRP